MKKFLAITVSLTFLALASSDVLATNLGRFNVPKNTPPNATDSASTGNTLQDRLQNRIQQKEQLQENLQNRKTQFEENTLERIKSRFRMMFQNMERHLNNLKTRVQNHPNIDEESENKILARLDRDINWLHERLAELEAISSLDELRAKRDEIKEYWQKIIAEGKYITGHILVARAKHFANRLEEAISKINEKIEELKTAGKDTSAAEDLITQAEGHLATAKEKFTLALQTFEQIETIQGSAELFQTGHNYLKEARQEAISALRLVKQAVVEVRKLSKTKTAGVSCGGWDTFGKVVCECTGRLEKHVCPLGAMCDSGKDTCFGSCGECKCYQGTTEVPCDGRDAFFK